MSEFNIEKIIDGIGTPEDWVELEALSPTKLVPGSYGNHDNKSAVELANESGMIISDVSAFDIADAIERALRPTYDATVVREGFRLDIDITSPTDS